MKITAKAERANEATINAALKAIHPEKRPMMSNGFRAQSVAACTVGTIEVTTSHGHTVHLATAEALKWVPQVGAVGVLRVHR